MSRVFNFSAGPATMPLPALQAIQEQLLDYGEAGMSVMEMSHRSADYQAIIDEAEALLRSLMDIPDNYHVLFLQGGATLQFSMVPLNLSKGGKLAYVDTGSWASKAEKEARALGYQVETLASSADDQYTYIPDLGDQDFSDYDYVHITSNNTIYGSQYASFPDTGGVPLVADMSSDIMGRPVNIEDFGLIYAGAQKNLGPAGVTIVIVRQDLVPESLDQTPVYLKYATHTSKGSLYNTPPTFAIYSMLEVLRYWDKVGLETVYQRNQDKAKLLYQAIDDSDLFHNPVRKEDRSLMNITFVTGDPDKDQKFIELAEKEKLMNLKGHRSVGGMRASIYNAFPLEGVEKLVKVMKEFEGMQNEN